MSSVEWTRLPTLWPQPAVRPMPPRLRPRSKRLSKRPSWLRAASRNDVEPDRLSRHNKVSYHDVAQLDHVSGQYVYSIQVVSTMMNSAGNQ